MEDGTVGKHCDFEGCNQKEYFAFFCKDCQKSFCADHRHATCTQTEMNAAVIPSTALSAAQLEEMKRKCNLNECAGEGLSFCNGCSEYFCL